MIAHHRNKIALAVAVMAGAALFFTTLVRGQGQADLEHIQAHRGQRHEAPTLEGTWRVDVFPTGAPAGTVIKALHTYAGGGVAVEYNSASSFPRYGVWKQLGRRTYASSWEALINNPNLPQIKRVRIRNFIRVEPGVTSFTGYGQVMYFDANGNQINSPSTGQLLDCATLQATRMEVEIPALACRAN